MFGNPAPFQGRISSIILPTGFETAGGKVNFSAGSGRGLGALSGNNWYQWDNGDDVNFDTDITTPICISVLYRAPASEASFLPDVTLLELPGASITYRLEFIGGLEGFGCKLFVEGDGGVV